MFTITVGEIEGLKELRESNQRDTSAIVGMLLHAIGLKTVADLRSLTDEMRPPARSGEGFRPAHPGHWADITGQLALAYEYHVDPSSAGGWVLSVSNNMSYAAELEARDGYFVLTGYMEPGGPVESILRDAVSQIAPDWTVSRGESDGE